MNTSRTMRTTTLEIKKPTNFVDVEREFRLVYYRLPASYVNAPPRSKKYEKLHIQLKNQLNQPYKTFDYASIDNQVIPVVYVLYRRNEDPALDEKPIELTWSKQKMQPQDLAFDRIPFHILLKLLQADYFRGNRERVFVSQGEFFILARQGREGNGAICLSIEVKGDRHNTDEMKIQMFHVTASARRFVRLKDPNSSKYLPQDSEKITPYFRREMRGTEGVFSQIRERELADFIKAGRPIFKIKRRKDKKPTLPYHDQLNLFMSRGGILYAFIENFCSFLGEKGIDAQPTFRTFHRFFANQEYANLPISRLGKIHIFDNRVQRDTDELKHFMLLLQTWLADNKHQLEIEIIQEIPALSRTPTLLLQDHKKEDFLEGGLFFENGITTDPKLTIYNDQSYKDTPKQSLNITTTHDVKQAKLRLHIALNQLLLKDLIVNRRPVSGILPGFALPGNELIQLSLFSDIDPTPLRDYAFVRRKTYAGETRTTVAAFHGDQLTFVNVSDTLEPLYKLCEDLELDWDQIYLKLHAIDFRVKNDVIDEGRELKRFDLILRNGQALVIEDIRETVLYEIGQMEERQKQLATPMPLDNFRLVNRAIPRDDKQANQFVEFDAFLDEISEEFTFSRISYKDLIDGENGTRIAQIFNLPKNDRNKYKFGNFKKIYQQESLNMLLSDKATSLHTYQGIWYDHDNRYFVGEPDGIKRKQATGNLIRQFTVLIGEPEVDTDLLLSTVGVQFIRPKRYTVYPYFYNLIDMYVNTP